jgi:hypothetical protein
MCESKMARENGAALPHCARHTKANASRRRRGKRRNTTNEPVSLLKTCMDSVAVDTVYTVGVSPRSNVRNTRTSKSVNSAVLSRSHKVLELVQPPPA